MTSLLSTKALRGLAWVFMQKWSEKILSIITYMILVRLLKPSDFGLVAICQVVIGFIDIFIAQGMGFAIIQKQNPRKGLINAAFWINVVSGAFMAIGLFTLSGVIAAFFKQPQLAPILKILSLLLIISGLSRIQSALLTKELAFKHLSIRQLGGSISGAAVGIVMAVKGFGVYSLVGQFLVSSAVSSLILWRYSEWRPTLKMEWRDIRELYTFSIKVLGDSGAVFIKTRLDEFLIGKYIDAVALGYYSVGKRVFLLFTEMFSNSVFSVMLPVFSKLQNDRFKLIATLCRTTEALSSIAMPVFILSASFSSLIIVVFFGKQWEPSGVIMMIISIGGIAVISPGLIYYTFYSIGRPGIPGILKLIYLPITIVFMFIGLQWGIVGIAIALVARDLVTAAIDMISLKLVINEVSLSKYLLSLFKPLVKTLPSLALVLLLFRLSWPVNESYRLCIFGGLAIILYIAINYIFDKQWVFTEFNTIKEGVLKRKNNS
jgi:O-antigen/teichoic acid export membrane protein